MIACNVLTKKNLVLLFVTFTHGLSSKKYCSNSSWGGNCFPCMLERLFLCHKSKFSWKHNNSLGDASRNSFVRSTSVVVKSNL